MANFVKTKPQLPKSILDMKFMKRTKDRLEREKRLSNDPKDVKPILNEAKWDTSNFIIEQSFIACEEFIEGRVSFKGMNPEIERLMELEKTTPEDTEKDISDEQLARHFKTSKRNRNIVDMDGHLPPKKIKREKY